MHHSTSVRCLIFYFHMPRRRNWYVNCYQFSAIDVRDARLQKRAVDVAIGCAEHPEESLAGRFDKWADLQGAYRFFSNPKITHQALQQPHYREVLENIMVPKI